MWKKLFKKPTLLDMKGEMNKISIKIMSVIRLFRNLTISFIKSGADILLLQFLSLKCLWQSAQSPVNKQTNKKGAQGLWNSRMPGCHPWATPHCFLSTQEYSTTEMMLLVSRKMSRKLRHYGKTIQCSAGGPFLLFGFSFIPVACILNPIQGLQFPGSVLRSFDRYRTTWFYRNRQKL